MIHNGILHKFSEIISIGKNNIQKKSLFDRLSLCENPRQNLNNRIYGLDNKIRFEKIEH